MRAVGIVIRKMLRIRCSKAVRRNPRRIPDSRCVKRRFGSETSLPKQADVVVVGEFGLFKQYGEHGEFR